MQTLISRLANEPVVKNLGALGVVQLVVAVLGILGVITGDQAAAIAALLAAAGTPLAVAQARSQTVGPVTAAGLVPALPDGYEGPR